MLVTTAGKLFQFKKIHIIGMAEGNIIISNIKVRHYQDMEYIFSIISINIIISGILTRLKKLFKALYVILQF